MISINSNTQNNSFLITNAGNTCGTGAEDIQTSRWF